MGMEAEVGKNLSHEEDAEAGKNSAEEEGELGENLAEEKEDKSIAVQGNVGPIFTKADLKEVREDVAKYKVEIDPGAEKSCNDDKTMDAEEPTSEGGSAVTNKGQIMLSEAEKTQVIDDAEKPHLPGVLAVLEEGDASKQAQLKEKKEKKRKRELVEVKKEHQEGTLLSKTEKKRKRKLVKIKKEHQEGTLLSKAEKKRWRVELVKIKEEHEMGSGEITWRWHAFYSMRLDRQITRLHEGSIFQRAKARHIFLLDMDGTAVDAYNLKEGESVHPGSVLYFPCHKADVGERILEPDVCSEDEAALALVERGIDDEKEKPPSKRDEKKRKHLKRKGMSPQAILLRSSVGMFARVASSRKRISPQAKRRKSESPSIPNVTAHFPSPNLPQRRRPRKLKLNIWKDFIPIYENGKVAQGRCKHCHEVFLASQRSGTNHIRRHVTTCVVRSNMHEMVAKLHASASSPQVAALDGWNFSQEESRRNLANMIVQHVLPFSIVEYSGFIKFMKSLNPMFKMVSRTTIKDDCMDSYKDQRSVLQGMLKNCGARVSLTADMWTSNQRLGYLCITCHFIDKAWKMQKRVIRFRMMETPHNGFRMYNAMLKSLQYWNIEDKVCSITLDNASVNGKMMDYLKENLTKKQMLICGGQLLHIRCAAHVLNFIVQDGLCVMKGSIDKIRQSVQYIKSSQTREELFEGIIKQLGIICEKEPSIDVATRWNSTYLMIESALPYMEAFEQLEKQDHQFKYAPSADDWKMAESILSLLKKFLEATKVVSGSKYPTANRYFHEIWSVKLVLERHAKSKNQVIASMVSKMQKKFDKYWKESYLANCVPVILDPRYKLEFVVFRINQAFGDNAAEHLKKVELIIKTLFQEYSHEKGDSLADPSEKESQVDEVEEIDNSLADWEAHLRVQKKQATSELDRYLSEKLFPRTKDFNILEWWEMHSPKYPVLSCIAHDVLAIQASTVASESSFSAGGRIISDHRTRLMSNTVEGLICLQDWLNAADSKPTNKDVEVEEYLVFQQGSKWREEGRARSRTRRLSTRISSSPSPSPASSSSPSP